ncbi:cation transporter, partial [Thiobacillus sp.]
MKTVTIEVGDLLSTLSALGVEKQLVKLPGVHRAEVNYVAGSATVVYDEAAIDLKAIKARVHECGYHCAGERTPKHVCVPEDPPATASVAGAPAPHAAHVHDEHETPQVHAEHAAPGKMDAMA